MDRRQVLSWAVAGIAASTLGTTAARAGVTYSSTTDASWFKPSNYNNGNGATATNAGPTSSDADIFNGQGYTSLTPDGVVFDPTNDPAYSTTYQTTSPSNPTTVNTTVYTTIPQLYLAGGSSSSTGVTDLAGKLTLKSGTLTVNSGSTGVAIGRPQTGTTSNTSERASLVLNGGSLSVTAANADIQMSSANSSSVQVALDQTNVLDYTNNSTITSVAKAGGGLRLGIAATPVGNTLNSTVILRHVASGTGAINLSSLILGAATAATSAGTVNSTLDYHYGGGNVDTINVGASGSSGTNTLTIRRGTATGGGGSYNSFLTLDLDEAPTVTGGNVQSLGLIDVQSGATGVAVTAGAISSTSGFIGLGEGSTVSASFGGNTYSWTLYYDGNIAGNTITGAGTGSDVVLIGNAFASTPEPASLGILALAGAGLTRRRRA